jgi:broad-specificity NMP kinase
MKLIFLYGAPAVGKLTVAQELARLTGYRLFHNHLTVDLVSSLFPFGSEPFVRLREKIWLAAFAEAARQDQSLIFTFNPERSVRERFIQDTIDVVSRENGAVVFVELTCAEQELERRMEDSSRKAFGKLASKALYRDLKESGAFEFPELPEGISLDTTNRSPAENAQAISDYVQRLESGGRPPS